MILLVSLALGVRVHTGVAGWLANTAVLVSTAELGGRLAAEYAESRNGIDNRSLA